MMNTPAAAVIIASRPDSKRVPRKAFRKIAGFNAIEHILRRLELAGVPYPVYVAVPFGMRLAYDPFVRAFPGVHLYEGDPDSPLHRMAACLDSMPALPKYVVRITHDDILIDGETVVSLVEKCMSENAGYGITPTIIEGAGVEVIHSANLIQAAYKITRPIEHVSYFVKAPGLPAPGIVRLRPRDTVERPYRLSLDYPEDLAVLETVLREAGPFAPLDRVAHWLDLNPHVLAYNRLPTVSIYTCARNAERHIYWAMNSVFNNGYPELEYIVVEDGSVDGTLQEIMRFAGKPFRLIVNEENMGLASSSNLAINAARGRYVLRLDADDFLVPGAIGALVDKARESEAGIVYPDYTEIDAAGSRALRTVRGEDNHHAGGALMDKRFIDEIRFRDGLRHWDSFELYERIKAQFPVAYLNAPLFMYRQHAASLSQSTDPARADALNEIKGSAQL
jgi:spore coat polysaccharide biosynthesis protein SpsF (cytidylyltransferase family)